MGDGLSLCPGFGYKATAAGSKVSGYFVLMRGLGLLLLGLVS